MVQRIDFQGGVIIWYKDTTKTTTMQEKNRKFSPPITHIFASL